LQYVDDGMKNWNESGMINYCDLDQYGV